MASVTERERDSRRSPCFLFKREGSMQEPGARRRRMHGKQQEQEEAGETDQDSSCLSALALFSGKRTGRKGTKKDDWQKKEEGEKWHPSSSFHHLSISSACVCSAFLCFSRFCALISVAGSSAHLAQCLFPLHFYFFISRSVFLFYLSLSLPLLFLCALCSPLLLFFLFVCFALCEVLCTISVTGWSAHGARIGMVFTPPQRRLHGYASRLTGPSRLICAARNVVVSKRNVLVDFVFSSPFVQIHWLLASTCSFCGCASIAQTFASFLLFYFSSSSCQWRCLMFLLPYTSSDSDPTCFFCLLFCLGVVCSQALSKNKQFCMLYADQNNPYSNAAYVRAGFKPIIQTQRLSFVPSSVSPSSPSSSAVSLSASVSSSSSSSSAYPL